MKIKQIYTGCLAQGTYYIESNNEAVIIDPIRETQPYIDKLKKEGTKLKYIFETHFHADFVSGHLDLAKKTGATIVFGPLADTPYDIYQAKDGEILEVGDITFKVLHTPGHTMESSVFLLMDEQGKDHAIFSGDTLFLGDVGRPDLAIKQGSLTKEDLAGYLYESLNNKIVPLADDVIVYPAHGAGSACGKNLSSETWGYLGEQKKTNYALNPKLSKEDFIKEVTSGLAPPPQYFSKNATLNKFGYGNFDEVLTKGNTSLTPEIVKQMVETRDVLILDTRANKSFADAHIPNSINIGIDGNFAPWVGAMITDIQQAIVLLTEEGREEEVVTRLSRVGYDNSLGFLAGGIEAWIKAGYEVDKITSITPEKFQKEYENGNVKHLIDVRKPTEFLVQHVEEAQNIPLEYLNSNMDKFDKNQEYYIHCAGGYRSMIAASILKSRGFHKLINIEQGFKGIEENGNFHVTAYACPTTMSQEVIDEAIAAVI